MSIEIGMVTKNRKQEAKYIWKEHQGFGSIRPFAWGFDKVLEKLLVSDLIYLMYLKLVWDPYVKSEWW